MQPIVALHDTCNCSIKPLLKRSILLAKSSASGVGHDSIATIYVKNC